MSSTDGFAGTAELILSFGFFESSRRSASRLTLFFPPCLFTARGWTFCCPWRASRPCRGGSAKEERERKEGARAEEKGRECQAFHALEVRETCFFFLSRLFPLLHSLLSFSLSPSLCSLPGQKQHPLRLRRRQPLPDNGIDERGPAQNAGSLR